MAWWVHELGHLFGLSGKFKTIFCNIATSEHGSFTTLKPLCPTRWTVRVVAVHSVLKQYEAVLLSLEEMASTGGSETATKVNGLLDRFQKGNTVLGLHLAMEVLEVMECLNKSLQKRSITFAGMQAAVHCVKTALQEKRTEGTFQQIFDSATELVTSLNISPIEMPRIRRPPKRLAGEIAAHAPAGSVDYFRREFYKMLDTADVQFRERFHQTSFEVLQKLENVLVTGKGDAIVDQYPEINRRMLDVH
ncbi:PREDICTED: zinc finger MYM-type protein 1-like [Scomber scombrus]|uniref:PREDICTED: zinc finger MYM-type protein 1-like n=1 Tax=Scomber scombrus TaxID=13677 RepID=A0AAV1PFT2_SCOSC